MLSHTLDRKVENSKEQETIVVLNDEFNLFSNILSTI
jgi:hypothetical protein